jgi:hypothetical protein
MPHIIFFADASSRLNRACRFHCEQFQVLACVYRTGLARMRNRYASDLPDRNGLNERFT